MATNEREDASFKEYVRAEMEKKDAEIASLKAQLAELKKQKGISSVSEGLSPNDKTGTWVDATGKHHCTKCLLKDERRVPLKTAPHGWSCMVCTKYYSDPDRPEDQMVYGPSGFP